MLLQTSSQIDWNKVLDIVVTLATILFGFALGRFSQWRNERKQTENLKNVLFWELSLIDNALYKLMNEKEQGLEADIQKCKTILSLDTNIYDNYLGKLNQLKTKELHSILFAYQSIKKLLSSALNIAQKIENMENIQENKFLITRMDLLRLRIKLTKLAIVPALNCIVKGRKDLEKYLNELYFSGDK